MTKAMGRRSMLADIATFQRRPVEGTDFDFRPQEDDWELPASCTQKGQEDEDLLERALQGNFLFQQLGEEQLMGVFSCFECMRVEPGEVIIRQGDEGDRFYVCGEGEFDVLVATGQEEEDEDPLGSVVHRYTADGNLSTPSFGDLALLYGTRREASVRAASRGVVWALTRNLFRLIQVLAPSAIPGSVLKTLHSVPFLAPLHFGQLYRLACFMRLHTLEDGDSLEIDSDTLYVVQSGELEVFDDTAEEDGKGGKSERGGVIMGGQEGRVGASVKHREGLEAPTINEDAILLGVQGKEGKEGGGDAKGRKGRRRSAVARGSTRCLSVAVDQFVGAVGDISEQSERDQRLRTFQALLQLERKRSSVIKAVAKTALADVEWEDTLSGNEWSEVGVVRVPGVESRLAMKRYGKERVARMKREVQVMREKTLLQTMSVCPFVPPLVTPLSDHKLVALLLNVRLCAPLALVMMDPLPEASAKFIAASLVISLQMLHKEGIVFRGISPGTVFLDENGRLQLADFRFSKRVADGRTFTLCGSPDFLAPEIIAGSGHGPAADWWALGVLIYMMLNGEGPFGSWKDSELQVYTRIARRNFVYPDTFSPHAISLIDQLLTTRPEDRLGCGVGGAEGVKNHPWFADVDWGLIMAVDPPPGLSTNGTAASGSSSVPPGSPRQDPSRAVPYEILRRLEEVKSQRAAMLEEERELTGKGQVGVVAPKRSGSFGSGLRTPRPSMGCEPPWFEGW